MIWWKGGLKLIQMLKEATEKFPPLDSRPTVKPLHFKGNDLPKKTLKELLK